MASQQRNSWSNRRGPRTTNPSLLPATQSSASRLGQWRQKYERYKDLAENSDSSDAVTREGHWQHAEHFIRLINETTAAKLAD
jgi:hypothetical protein